MARLTWQDVAAPNLSAAIQGMSAAGDALNQGFNNIRATANTVDSSISQRVNSALQMQMLGAKNAEEVQAILSGADPRRVNSSSINMAAERPGQIIDLALKDLGLKRETLGFERSEDRYARNEAAEDDWRTVFGLRRDGKNAEADAYIAGNEDLRNVPLDDWLSRQGTGDRLGDDKFGRDQRDYNWDRTLDDHLVQDQTNKLLAEARISGKVNTVGDAMEWLRTQKVSDPRVYNRLAQEFGFPGLINDTNGGGIPGPGGKTIGDIDLRGGPAGANALGIMNYEARAKGFNSVPSSVKTLGQASAFAKQVNRAGASSSAMGLYQITGDTMRDFGPRVFKDGWQNVEWNGETQDKLGKAIFEASKGSAQALRNRWVSLSLEEAEQLRKRPWEEARQVIARKESGGDPSSLIGITTPAAQEAQFKSATNRGRAQAMSDASASSGLYNAYAKFSGNGKSVDEIAAIQRSKNSLFKGESQDVMVTRLQQVIDRAAEMELPINAAQAAKILEYSLTEKGVGTKIGNWMTGGVLGDALSLGNVGDRSVDWAKLDSNITDLAGGGAESRKGQEDAVAIAAREEAVTEQRLSQATQYLQALKARRAHPEVLRREVAKVQGLQAELARIRKAQQSVREPGAELIKSRDPGTRTTRPAATTGGKPPKNSSWWSVFSGMGAGR